MWSFTVWFLKLSCNFEKVKVIQSCLTLQLHRLYSPWNSAGQNTGVGSLPLLQGSFPTKELEPGLPHCRLSLYQVSHKGSPRILERVAYPFSSRSFPPTNRTRVSCIAGRFFTNWAIKGQTSQHQQQTSCPHSPSPQDGQFWIFPSRKSAGGEKTEGCKKPQQSTAQMSNCMLGVLI